MAEKWTKVERDFVILGGKDEDGNAYPTEVEGTLIEKGEVVMSGNPVGRYKIERENGTVVTVLGSSILDDYLGEVEPGTEIKIVFTGTTKAKSGFATKTYDVFKAE